MKIQPRSLERRKLLLKAYGMYATYRGKALNPEDVEITFLEESKDGGEATHPMLEVFKVIRETMGKTRLQRLFKQ